MVNLYKQFNLLLKTPCGHYICYSCCSWLLYKKYKRHCQQLKRNCFSQIKNKKSTIKGNKNNISLNLNDSMKLTKKKNLRNSVSDINNKTSNLTNKTVNHNRLTDFNKHNDNLVNNLKCNYYHFISRHRKSSWLIGNKRYQGKNGGVYLNEIEEQSNTDSKSRTLLTRNLEEDIGLLRNSSKSIFSTNSIFTKNSKKLQRTNSTIMKKEEITQISDHKMNKIRDILNKMTKGKTDDEIDVELVNRYMNITSISSDVNLTPIIIKRNQFKDNFEKNDLNFPTRLMNKLFKNSKRKFSKINTSSF